MKQYKSVKILSNLKNIKFPCAILNPYKNQNRHQKVL